MEKLIQILQTKVNELSLWLEGTLNGNEFAIAFVTTGILGYVMFALRYIPSKISASAQKHLTTSLEVNSINDSYFNLVQMLQEEGVSASTRIIKLLNGRWGSDGLQKSIGYGSQYFIFRKKLVKISISKVEGTTQNQIDNIFITKIGRSHDYFDKIIKELHSELLSDDKTRFYSFDDSYSQFIVSQPARSFDSVFISSETKKEIIDTLNDFKAKEQFYIKHGIPYQLGMLLYGPPGTGKTSILKAIAEYTKKSITTVSSASALANACQTEKDTIIVAEEVDTFGIAKRENLHDANTPSSDKVDSNEEKPAREDKQEKDKQEKDRFDALFDDLGSSGLGKLLNSIDGLVSNHGRIMIMTTNKPLKLDEALLRPGRIDLRIEIGYITNEAFCEMMNRFFPNKILPSNFNIKNKITGTVIQNEILKGKSFEEITTIFNNRNSIK